MRKTDDNFYPSNNSNIHDNGRSPEAIIKSNSPRRYNETDIRNRGVVSEMMNLVDDQNVYECDDHASGTRNQNYYEEKGTPIFLIFDAVSATVLSPEKFVMLKLPVRDEIAIRSVEMLHQNMFPDILYNLHPLPITTSGHLLLSVSIRLDVSTNQSPPVYTSFWVMVPDQMLRRRSNDLTRIYHPNGPVFRSTNNNSSPTVGRIIDCSSIDSYEPASNFKYVQQQQRQNVPPGIPSAVNGKILPTVLKPNQRCTYSQTPPPPRRLFPGGYHPEVEAQLTMHHTLLTSSRTRWISVSCKPYTITVSTSGNISTTASGNINSKNISSSVAFSSPNKRKANNQELPDKNSIKNNNTYNQTMTAIASKKDLVKKEESYIETSIVPSNHFSLSKVSSPGRFQSVISPITAHPELDPMDDLFDNLLMDRQFLFDSLDSHLDSHSPTFHHLQSHSVSHPRPSSSLSNFSKCQSPTQDMILNSIDSIGRHGSATPLSTVSYSKFRNVQDISDLISPENCTEYNTLGLTSDLKMKGSSYLSGQDSVEPTLVFGEEFTFDDTWLLDDYSNDGVEKPGSCTSRSGISPPPLINHKSPQGKKKDKKAASTITATTTATTVITGDDAVLSTTTTTTTTTTKKKSKKGGHRDTKIVTRGQQNNSKSEIGTVDQAMLIASPEDHKISFEFTGDLYKQASTDTILDDGDSDVDVVEGGEEWLGDIDLHHDFEPNHMSSTVSASLVGASSSHSMDISSQKESLAGSISVVEVGGASKGGATPSYRMEVSPPESLQYDVVSVFSRKHYRSPKRVRRWVMYNGGELLASKQQSQTLSKTIRLLNINPLFGVQDATDRYEPNWFARHHHAMCASAHEKDLLPSPPFVLHQTSTSTSSIVNNNINISESSTEITPINCPLQIVTNVKNVFQVPMEIRYRTMNYPQRLRYDSSPINTSSFQSALDILLPDIQTLFIQPELAKELLPWNQHSVSVTYITNFDIQSAVTAWGINTSDYPGPTDIYPIPVRYIARSKSWNYSSSHLTPPIGDNGTIIAHHYALQPQLQRSQSLGAADGEDVDTDMPQLARSSSGGQRFYTPRTQPQYEDSAQIYPGTMEYVGGSRQEGYEEVGDLQQQQRGLVRAKRPWSESGGVAVEDGKTSRLTPNSYHSLPSPHSTSTGGYRQDGSSPAMHMTGFNTSTKMRPLPPYSSSISSGQQLQPQPYHRIPSEDHDQYYNNRTYSDNNSTSGIGGNVSMYGPPTTITVGGGGSSRGHLSGSHIQSPRDPDTDSRSSTSGDNAVFYSTSGANNYHTSGGDGSGSRRGRPKGPARQGVGSTPPRPRQLQSEDRSMGSSAQYRSSVGGSATGVETLDPRSFQQANYSTYSPESRNTSSYISSDGSYLVSRHQASGFNTHDSISYSGSGHAYTSLQPGDQGAISAGNEGVLGLKEGSPTRYQQQIPSIFNYSNTNYPSDSM